MNIALLNMHDKHCSKQNRENLAMHIGKRIQQIMKTRGITTKAMASCCGVTPGAGGNLGFSGLIAILLFFGGIFWFMTRFKNEQDGFFYLMGASTTTGPETTSTATPTPSPVNRAVSQGGAQ